MPQIQDVGFVLAKGQDTTVVVTFATAPAGLGTWAGFRLTLREVPSWPLSGAAAAAAKRGELNPDGWSAAAALTTATVVGSTVEITVPRATTLALRAGVNRYVADVWRVESGADWQIVPPTWVTVLPSVRDG